MERNWKMKSDKPVIDEHFLLNINYKSHKMDKLDSHADSIVKKNTEYLVHLIRIALADDVISTKELELLHRVSKNKDELFKEYQKKSDEMPDRSTNLIKSRNEELV